MSQLLTQLQDLQNKVNSLSDARDNFTILKQGAALERPTFPVNPFQFRVPEPCLAAILDWRMMHGILWVLQETFLNDYLLEMDEFKELASSSQGLRLDIPGKTKQPGSEMTRAPQNSSIPVPRFQRGGGLLNHTGGTYSHGDLIDFPSFRSCIWEIFLTLWNFKAGKSTSRLKLFETSRSASHNALDQRS